jgi:uncharacterized protein (DUF1330 family)
MAVYLIGAIDIEDVETYARYGAMADASVAGHAITPLAIDDNPLTLEGDLPSGRMVLFQFDNIEAMNRWYESDAYQKAKQHRVAGATTHFLVALQGGLPTT